MQFYQNIDGFTRRERSRIIDRGRVPYSPRKPLALEQFQSVMLSSRAESRETNCHPNLCAVPRHKRAIGTELTRRRSASRRSQYRQRARDYTLLASLRAITRTSEPQLSCRIYPVYERSSSNAEYAREPFRAIPRVFPSRRAHVRYATNAR